MGACAQKDFSAGGRHGVSDGRADARGYWKAAVEAAECGSRYGFLLDEDPIPLSRSAFALAARGRAQALAALRPPRLRVEGCALARRPAILGRDVRAAHRHLHSGGHVRLRDRAAGLPRRAWHHACGTDARGAVGRRPRLGLRRRGYVRRDRRLRRSGCDEALRRRMPSAPDRGDPRRGLQPLRAGGQLHGKVRRRTSRTGIARRGETRSTSSGKARTRCADSSSTTR